MSSRTGPAARLRNRRLRRRVITGAVMVGGLLIAISIWLLHPPRHSPTQADAVMVLAGQSDGRHQLGAQLVEDGYADNLVVSNPSGTRDLVGSRICRGDQRPEGAETWCLRPDPVTTAGEAMTVGRLAADEGWSSVNVVTNRPHTHRVRMIFDQCTDLDVTVVNVEWVDWRLIPYHVAREIGGFIKHWIVAPCAAVGT